MHKIYFKVLQRQSSVCDTVANKFRLLNDKCITWEDLGFLLGGRGLFWFGL